jgi:hypothetical protein
MVTQCNYQNGGHIQWAMDLLAQRCRAIFFGRLPRNYTEYKKAKEKGVRAKALTP